MTKNKVDICANPLFLDMSLKHKIQWCEEAIHYHAGQIITNSPDQSFLDRHVSCIRGYWHQLANLNKNHP